MHASRHSDDDAYLVATDLHIACVREGNHIRQHRCASPLSAAPKLAVIELLLDRYLAIDTLPCGHVPYDRTRHAYIHQVEPAITRCHCAPGLHTYTVMTFIALVYAESRW